MELDIPLIVSCVLNLVLIALTVILGSKNVKLTDMLNLLNRKLSVLTSLVVAFIEAYQDRVITKEEAKKLIDQFQKLLNDP